MNFEEKRKVMFGEKLVIEMDIDPDVSCLDTPVDVKIPVFVMNNNRTTCHMVKNHSKDEIENVEKIGKVDGKISGEGTNDIFESDVENRELPIPNKRT